MNEPSEFETRKKLFHVISKYPGLNLSRISEMLNLSVPLLLYHLRYLEKYELITVEREKGFSRCYAKGDVGVNDRKKLSILQQETPLRIVVYLLKYPYSRHKDILNNFAMSKSTLSYHLTKLVNHEIITVHSLDGEQRYVVINEKEINKLIIKYRPSRVALGLKDTWVDFTARKKKK